MLLLKTYLRFSAGRIQQRSLPWPTSPEHDRALLTCTLARTTLALAHFTSATVVSFWCFSYASSVPSLSFSNAPSAILSLRSQSGVISPVRPSLVVPTHFTWFIFFRYLILKNLRPPCFCLFLHPLLGYDHENGDFVNITMRNGTLYFFHWLVLDT